MFALPVKGAAEILPTEGSEHMLMLMDRIMTVAQFSPKTPKHAEAYEHSEAELKRSYVGKRRAAE